MCVVAAKKKHHDIPRDFSHYSNEFDFECDEEAPCWDNIAEVTKHAADPEFKSVELAPPSLYLEKSESMPMYNADDCLKL